MSLVILYKLYKTFNSKEDKKITKNRNNLIKIKYLKKVSF